MALFLGSNQKGTFSGATLFLRPLIFLKKAGSFLKRLVLSVPESREALCL
jgi:hypothetical protein